MTRSPLLHRYWMIYRKKPALCVSFQFYYPILCNFKYKLYFYFHHAAANNSSTTTVSLLLPPDYQNGQSPLEQPNGNDVSADDDGNSSEANAAKMIQIRSGEESERPVILWNQFVAEEYVALLRIVYHKNLLPSQNKTKSCRYCIV